MPLSFDAGLALLARNASSDPHALLAAVVEPLGVAHPVIYLADFGHQTLMPLPVPMRGSVPVEEQIGTSLAGRAFVTGRPVSAQRDGHSQVWVPLLEGTERTGVVRVSVPGTIDEDLLADLELLGVFAGLVLAAAANVSDLPHLRRRGRSMSLAATMQWELMPPLSASTPEASVAGVLEPAYDIAGDAFDYAFNGQEVDFGIFDGMGHGISSSLLTGLAVGAYRHARREHASIGEAHRQVERAIVSEYAGEAFVTGILARLNLSTGLVTWSCAGHPPPLLLRRRQVVGELACEPSLPFGFGQDEPTVATRTLQPGDALLLYTDGVIEARTPAGEEFGLARLVDQLEREAASEHAMQEVLRRLVRSVVDHRVDRLRDDATLLLTQWVGAAVDVPSPAEMPRQRAVDAPR